jgi:hypothetical protein
MGGGKGPGCVRGRCLGNFDAKSINSVVDVSLPAGHVTKYRLLLLYKSRLGPPVRQGGMCVDAEPECESG